VAAFWVAGNAAASQTRFLPGRTEKNGTLREGAR
jgi:hypothetical protein